MICWSLWVGVMEIMSVVWWGFIGCRRCYWVGLHVELMVVMGEVMELMCLLLWSLKSDGIVCRLQWRYTGR